MFQIYNLNLKGKVTDDSSKVQYEILDSRELWSISTAGTNTAYSLERIFVHN